MNKNIKNILKEKLILSNINKLELNNKILKSIRQNNNTNNLNKVYSYFLIDKITTKNNIFSKKHKVCINTGKRNGLFKNISFSRYSIKKLISMNRYNNIKKKLEQ